MTYHKVTTEEIPVFTNYCIAFTKELTGDHPPEDVEGLRKQLHLYFNKAIASGSCIAYMAKHNHNVTGIGAMVIREQPGSFKNPSGSVGYLMHMYTIPAFRRRGICTHILKILLSDTAQKGITAFELHSTKQGEGIYKQNGFELRHEPTYRKFIHIQ